MNKKFEKCFTDYGLTVGGDVACGTVKGYELGATVKQWDMAPVRIHIACYATPEQRAAIENALANRTDIKGQKQMTEFGLSLMLNDLTVNRMIKNLPAILDWTLGMLAANGALGVGYCPRCGKPLDAATAKKCSIDGMPVTLDPECVATVNNQIDSQNAQYNTAPNNYLRGFLGALIGGVVGGLTVALFYYIGIISALSGIVAAALGAFLYTKFGGKPNRPMIVIVTLTSLACLVASVFITYIVASGSAARDAGFHNISGLEAFKILMTDDEFSNAFYTDLAMVILFAVVGMGFYVWVLWRSMKGKGKQQHITEKPVDPFDGATQTSKVESSTEKIDVFEEYSTTIDTSTPKDGEQN